jgi:hypothetical protein
MENTCRKMVGLPSKGMPYYVTIFSRKFLKTEDIFAFDLINDLRGAYKYRCGNIK